MTLFELFKDALPIIERVAPILASSLGSPFSNIALSLISHAVQESPKNPQLIANKIVEHDCVEELKKIEAQHGEWLESLLSVKKPPQNIEMTINLKFPDNRTL